MPDVCDAEFTNRGGSLAAKLAGSWRTGSPRSGRACASCSTSRSWSAASRRFRCVRVEFKHLSAAELSSGKKPELNYAIRGHSELNFAQTIRAEFCRKKYLFWR